MAAQQAFNLIVESSNLSTPTKDRKLIMGRGIVKLGKEWYVEWSTVVDAPVTFGMNREELIEYLFEQEGYKWHDLDDPRILEIIERDVSNRLERIDQKGTSFYHYRSADFIKYNRAGKNETRLDLNQLIDWYCIQKKDPEIEGEKL